MDKTNGAVSLLNLTAQVGLPNIPNMGKMGSSSSDISFSETLMKTSEVKPIEPSGSEIAGKKTVVENASGTQPKNIKTNDDAIGQKKESLTEDEVKDVAKVVDEASKKIEEKIKSELEVSDDEFNEAMESLGLSVIDLFDPVNVRNLMMELTGTEDSIELLTNVELYDSVKDVTSFAEALFRETAEELNLSTEQLTTVIDSENFEQALISATDDSLTTETNEETVDVSKENGEKVDEVVTPNAESEKIVITDEAEKTVALNETKNEEKQPEIKVEVTKSEEVRTQDPVVTNEQPKNESFAGNKNGEKDNLFDNSKNHETNASNIQTVTTQTVNTVGDIVETVTSYSTYADTENIMKQVTDYVKVNITSDVTKMEMQLHPASLGTVNMQISSQGGQITAHLTVQNELVKSVLESQMIKLQETFNEQGSKVTAIEVSVANYNLDAKSENNFSQERENQSGRSKSRRSINLNELSSFDELTDEEQLEAEVMEMNGSSVNYTA